jgi:transposase
VPIDAERQLMVQLNYNLLYRWFVGLGVNEPAWVPTVRRTAAREPHGKPAPRL